jgi:hypothetical protein
MQTQMINGDIKSKKKFDKIFFRESLNKPLDIIRWWNRGRFLLNAIVLTYSLFHLMIMLFVFKNGFIIFLLPIIFYVVLLVNVIYSLGLVFELIAKFVFHYNLQLDNAYSIIKQLQFAISILLVLGLSAYGIITET